MKARRTHLKSRTGCSTCRTRRIKCDESKPQCMNCTRRQVRCDFLGQLAPSQSFSGDSSPQAARILRANTDSDIQTSDEPQSLQSLFPLSQFPDLSKQERFLVAHACKISDDMVKAGVESLDLGLSLTPEIHRIAASRDFVRHAVCGLASTHVALLTQSSSMNYLAYSYRDLALRGLRESLTVLSQDNVDAMLAASWMLSWQASESQEFMQTMKGVDLALIEMNKLHHKSRLRTLIQPDSQAEVLRSAETLYQVDVSLDLACSSLQDLRRKVADDVELTRGVKELLNYLQNLRISPPGKTQDEQLQALYPIRYWLPWLPKALLRLSDKDPLVMLFLAHYNMVALAVEPILPASRSPFALEKRVDFIERVEAMLDDGGKIERRLAESSRAPGRRRRESIHALMFGPLAFAKEWRKASLSLPGFPHLRRATLP